VTEKVWLRASSVLINDGGGGDSIDNLLRSLMRKVVAFLKLSRGSLRGSICGMIEERASQRDKRDKRGRGGPLHFG
jgi:hypothetical protein